MSLQEVKAFFQLTFNVCVCRSEEDLVGIFDKYEKNTVLKNTYELLQKSYLNSYLLNHGILLQKLSKVGLMALQAWLLSFPISPSISTTQHSALNSKLFYFEREITLVLFKVLEFLKDNHEQSSECNSTIFVPYMNSKALNIRYPKLSVEFKIVNRQQKVY